MIVVSDTSPINYLVQIGQIEVLPRLFSRVLVPEAVMAELSATGAPDAVSDWLASAPLWLEVRESSHLIMGTDLDRGEAEALALAMDLGLTALIDDRKGRECAAALGVPFVGTIGILNRAAQLQMLDFEECLRDLMATNFHLSKAHLHALLEEWAKDQSRNKPESQEAE